MPSVTRLLNRNKIFESTASIRMRAEPPPVPTTGMSGSPLADAAEAPTSSSIPSLESPPEAQQTAQEQPSEITLSFAPAVAEIESSPSPAGNAAPMTVKIQPARPLRKPPAPALARWSAPLLAKSADPLAQGLARLLELGAQRALFLAMGTGGSGTPVFQASAALAPDAEIALWSGLKWDPAIVPETWNQFLKTGIVELAPPATNTNVKSQRNVLRAAFGVTQGEWLILIRAGTAQKCRGILAAVAPRGLINELPPIVQLMAKAIPTAGPSKAA